MIALGADYANHIYLFQLDFEILLRACKFFALSIVAKWHFPWEINLSDIGRQFFVKAFFSFEFQNEFTTHNLNATNSNLILEDFFSFCKVLAWH